MKICIHMFFVLLFSSVLLHAAEIGIDTDNSSLKTKSIHPELSPAEKHDVEGLSHFGASLFSKDYNKISEQLLAALAANPNSSRVLAFILRNFQNYNVSQKHLQKFISIAEANPKALALNVAALTLVDCVKFPKRSSITVKKNIAKRCIQASNPDKFDELEIDLFQGVVKTLTMIYLHEKNYSEGNELFEKILENKNVFKHNIFLQQAVIFYTEAADRADKDRRLVGLLPSRSSQYEEKKKELLRELYTRSEKTEKMNKLIKHLTFLQKIGMYDDAKGILLEQLAKQPLTPVLQVAAAELFNKHGKYALAAMIWQKMLDRNPKDCFFHLKVAENAFRAKQYKRATENYRAIFKSSSEVNNLSTVFMLAVSELQNGNLKEAWSLLSILPENQRFGEIKAHTLSLLGKDKEAFKVLSGMVLNNPGKADSKLYFFWLTMAIKSQSPKVQLKCLEILRKHMDLKDPEVANSIGYTYADLNKKLQYAEKMIAYALSSKPESPEYLDSMAWIYFRMKKFKKAAEYIEKALSRSGKYPDAVIADHAGDIFNATGDSKRALYYWKLALKIFSKDVDKNKIKQKIEGENG